MHSISEALIWIYHFAVGLDISKWSATFVIFFFSRVSQNCRTSSISSCFFTVFRLVFILFPGKAMVFIVIELFRIIRVHGWCIIIMQRGEIS